ncbi:hypothetical protein EJD97_019899 [Solanum chilense]|uniref:Uncharacterized protein n=1 Tax=Solanum chilense TaxID=4083 RepID=A0A6N2AH66_SOLCI|nr:hypothetical protein EJD97_019899 [Solanum chilense]
MMLNHHQVKFCIPTAKILEVIATKKCLQNFHFKSLEKLANLFSDMLLVYNRLRLMKIIMRVFSTLKKIKSFPMLIFSSLDVIVKF